MAGKRDARRKQKGFFKRFPGRVMANKRKRIVNQWKNASPGSKIRTSYPTLEMWLKKPDHHAAITGSKTTD